MLTTLGVGGQAGLLAGQPGWLDPNIGFTTQALGRAAANAWLAGSVPWWNPFSGVGVPLAAEMQPAALFLPFILLLKLNSGVVLLRVVLQSLAGLATYQLLRELRLRPTACLVGGLLTAFWGTLVWFPDSPSHPIAFLPVTLYGVERARHAAMAGRRGGWAWIAVGLAFSLVAGFPETAYIDGLLVALWSAWRLFGAHELHRGDAARSAGAAWRYSARVRLLGKLAAGVTVGLLLAAPAVWPFLHLLGQAEVGLHNVFARAAMRIGSYPMFVVPYLYGNIAGFGAELGPDGPTWWLWGGPGGYVGVTCAALAVPGLLNWRGRELGLRLALGGWVVACLAKTAALPGVTDAFNLLPFIAEAAFFHYAEASWTFACVVLAAFAVDAWLAGRLPRSTWVAAIAVELVLGVPLARLAGPAVRWLVHDPVYVAYLIGILEWSLGLFAATAALLFLRAGRHAARLLVVLVGVDAVTMAGLPLLASTRHRTLDLAPIAFLRERLGLQRFYSLGAIAPNYGAYYGLASINETLVPLPQTWADEVRRLDPLASAIAFDGRARPGAPDRQPLAALEARPDPYRALGVRYVVMPAGAETATHATRTAPFTGSETPRPLMAGEAVKGRIAPGTLTAGEPITQVGIRVGTYGGLADGELSATFCSDQGCGHGRGSLTGAADNAELVVDLDRPVTVPAASGLTFELRHDGGRQAVAVWTSAQSVASITSPTDGPGPVMSLVYQRQGDVLRPVFHDGQVEIFELAGAADYFTTAPRCALDATDRQHVAADCPIPARLIRRELAFPGWRASVGGSSQPILTEGIFQAINLPAGRSDVRYAYAPPFAGLAWAASAAGAAWLLLAALLARRQGRARAVRVYEGDRDEHGMPVGLGQV